jgi:hypothetical protein
MLKASCRCYRSSARYATILATKSDTSLLESSQNWPSSRDSFPNEHFSVDGSIIEALANHRSFARKYGSGSDHAHGHSSVSTDPFRRSQ